MHDLLLCMRIGIGSQAATEYATGARIFHYIFRIELLLQHWCNICVLECAIAIGMDLSLRLKLPARSAGPDWISQTTYFELMQYTKPMVDLVLQIRKKAPAHLKPAIKLADPDLLNHLVRQYTHPDAASLRGDVAQLMALAGPVWSAQLTRPAVAATHKSSKMVYRGQKICREAEPGETNGAP